MAAGGLIYPSVEHALQASKAVGSDEATRQKIRKAPTAVDAKRIGNKLPLPVAVSTGGAAAKKKAWKLRSREIVEALLRDKFRRNKSLAQELVETRGKELVYDNQWNDRFWGVSGGAGHNYLGALLEKVGRCGGAGHDWALGMSPSTLWAKASKPWALRALVLLLLLPLPFVVPTCCCYILLA